MGCLDSVSGVKHLQVVFGTKTGAKARFSYQKWAKNS